jgi:hypothetical protein
MSSRSRNKSKNPLRDLADFRASLWKTLAKNANGLSGPQVVRALREVSDDIYHAGIDGAYTTTKVRDPQNLADAWDLTWLTALSVGLLHLQKARSRPRQRRQGRNSATPLDEVPGTAIARRR